MATSIQIDDELKSRVQHLAHSRRRSAHGMVREAIEQYVEREEKQEALKQEALRAWAAYRATGRHLTGQEAAEWLHTWGTADEKPVPECHE